MDKILEKLSKLVETPSDINEHLLTLKQYSDGCSHITEMGVREVVSTWALLASKPKKLVCIDINLCDLSEISIAASEADVNLQFIQDSTVRNEFEIEETDFLFIDTWHVYTQLKKELSKHASKVKKYIAFHDTETYKFVNENKCYSNPTGLKPAVDEFLENNTEWVMHKHYEHNNGLTIIKRVNPAK